MALSIILILLLACLFPGLKPIWILAGFALVCFKTCTLLVRVTLRVGRSRFRGRSVCNVVLLTDDIEEKTPTPIILHRPLFHLHNIIYESLVWQFLHLPPDQQSTLLSGRRFASLAESIISNAPFPVVADMSLGLPSQDEMEYLQSLPEVIVTPPGDGDRKALPGEREGPPKIMMRRFLAPPVVVRGRRVKVTRGKKRALREGGVEKVEKECGEVA